MLGQLGHYGTATFSGDVIETRTHLLFLAMRARRAPPGPPSWKGEKGMRRGANWGRVGLSAWVGACCSFLKFTCFKQFQTSFPHVSRRLKVEMMFEVHLKFRNALHAPSPTAGTVGRWCRPFSAV